METRDTSVKPSRPFRVFISYARADSAFLQALEKHLANLRQQGWIEDWSDRQFIAGDVWAPLLRQKLQTSELVLLLVSADFNASDFIQQEELPRIIQRHRHEDIRVVPILVRSADTQGAFVETVQCLPLDEQGKVRPIDLWPNSDQAWLTVVQALRRVLASLETVRRKRQVRHRATAGALLLLGLGAVGVGTLPRGLELEVWAVAQASSPLAPSPDRSLSSPVGDTGSEPPLRPLSQGGEVHHSEALQVYHHVSSDAFGMVLTERRQGGMSILLPAEGAEAVPWPSQEREATAPLGRWVLDASPGEEHLLILAAREPTPLRRWLLLLRAEEQRAGSLSSGWGGPEPEGEQGTTVGQGDTVGEGDSTGDPPCPGGIFRPDEDLTRQLLACFPETQQEQQVALARGGERALGTQARFSAQQYSVLKSQDRSDVGLTWVWLRLNHVERPSLPAEGSIAPADR